MFSYKTNALLLLLLLGFGNSVFKYAQGIKLGVKVQ